MSMFTGVSVIDGENQSSCNTSAIYTGVADSGYHLLMVTGYSHTKEELHTGECASTSLFTVGGHDWYVEYYPNGLNKDCADFISLNVILPFDNDPLDMVVEAKLSFSLIDQVEKQNPMYIRAASKTSRFSSAAINWGSDKFVRRDALERSSDLKGDCFTIRCDIMVVSKDPRTEGASGTLSDIHQHLSNLLQTKVGADVTFEVSGERFAAHRCVLAARSKVFMAQLFGPMKETSTVIHIKDMEAKVFRALLSFIYTDLLPMIEDEKSQDLEEGQVEEVVQHEMRLQCLQDLFVAADRYDLQQLKFICEKQLSEQLGVSSVMSTLVLAEQHQCQGLKEACMKFVQVQSPSCLQTVMATNGWDHAYTTYPSVLKELFVKIASNRRK
ncbi:BTB/POZ and MATH domain-containing protein 3-like [Hordeum vulgare subsp. vulgare]|uniref:BTB domain-containing protein n=1 Tax=Hordeum vulgare subsp. vulgare TaxID=112509 RepID=A0A8I6Y2P6_HORVV|nr:BTB/POZ and MATH domain-containing protein 3-like [Hordeum vulgare subsp. vulgare]